MLQEQQLQTRAVTCALDNHTRVAASLEDVHLPACNQLHSRLPGCSATFSCTPSACWRVQSTCSVKLYHLCLCGLRWLRIASLDAWSRPLGAGGRDSNHGWAGPVIPRLVLSWLLCETHCTMWSVLGLVGPLSIYCHSVDGNVHMRLPSPRGSTYNSPCRSISVILLSQCCSACYCAVRSVR